MTDVLLRDTIIHRGLFYMKKGFWLEHRSIVAIAVCLLALAEIVDLTIVAVAIPHIMGALGCNIQEVSLVTTSYIVAAAVFIMTTGFVSSRLGSKKTILLSTLVFGVSSVLCGFASSLNEMVLFRLIQGIGGAFLPSMAQGYIVGNFDEEEQPKMMSIMTLTVVLGPIIGPLAGGYLVNAYSWRCIFFVNVPICLVAFLIVFFWMKETVTTKINFDSISFAFMAIGFGSLEYFIDEGNNLNWFNSHLMVICLCVGLVFITFFVWRGIRGSSVVSFELFKNFNFVISCSIVFMFMVAVTTGMAFYATFLQQGYNFPVDVAGYITAPRGVCAVIGGILGSILCSKFDKRIILIGGLLLFSCGCWIETHFGTNWSLSTQLLTCAVVGLSMSMTFTPLLQVAFTGVTEALSNDASGVFNFFRNIGNSVGTSIASTVLSRNEQVSWNDLSSHLTPFSNAVQQMQNGVLQGMSIQKQITVFSQQVQAQAFLIANINLFYLGGIMALFLCLLPMFLDKPPKGMIKVHAL
ncbi:MAG: DHA2 family efflux MFS transporter permease subunit [Neisseriaceae bacterium]|nr:MAG: DHA2 family efflux MFS transporter permease subunit [Neisseriaceae bacterium]